MEVEEASDEDGFRPVVGKRKRRGVGGDRPVAGEGIRQENLLNNNIFNSLGENNNNNNGDAAGNDGVQPAPAANKQQKQPPVVVKNMGFQELMRVLSSCRTKPRYKLTSYGIKLEVRTAGGYDILRSHLKENNVEFYTHEKRCERPYRVVIRGLPLYGPQGVKKILKEYHNLDALEVHAIRRKGDFPAREEVPYIVVFPKGYTNLNTLREIKRIGAIIVRWEAYRIKRPNVTQCGNCLHLGHGTRNCHLKGRCNNCGGAHKTDECQVQDAQPKRCANCSGAHGATDRSCPKRAEFIRARQQAAKPKTPAKKAEKRSSAVPVFNLADFPPLPDAVPAKVEKNPRPRGANKGDTGSGAGGTTKEQGAAGSSQENAGPRAGVNSKAEGEEELYSSAELWKIFVDFSVMLKSSRTRSDQLAVLGYMICKYGSK